MEAVLWIRIPYPDWIRIQEGKIDPEKKNTVNKFNLLKYWMFFFKG
jgi:hypothetical protein